jgi:hypothetical protein
MAGVGAVRVAGVWMAWVGGGAFLALLWPGCRPSPSGPTAAMAPATSRPDTPSWGMTTAAVGPAAVAADFALAYLSALPGEAAEVRAGRCRPFDTDQLNQQLSGPTWSGASGSSAPGPSATVTVTSLNATSTTTDGVGYELAATVVVSAPDRAETREQRSLELWLVAGAGGRWQVDRVH